MKRLLPALLLCSGLLVSCQRQAESGQPDLTTRVLFTANGSYDAQADQRGKKPGSVGVRAVQWRQQPPLPARAVTVEYDGEQRTRGWQMLVEQPEFAPADFAASAPREVSTPEGAGTLLTAGPLRGVLVLPEDPGSLKLLTRGYAVQHAAALLPAFDAP